MRKVYTIGLLLLIVAIAAVIVRSRRHSPPVEIPFAAETGQTRSSNSVEEPEKPRRRPFGNQAVLPSKTNGSPLEQEYQRMIAAHPSLTNVYDKLVALSLRDPFASDLFHDACLFISLRSSILGMIESEEKDHASMVARWSRKTNADPVKVEVMLHTFGQSREKAIADYRQVIESISKGYAERFRTRHGMDGDAAVAQILALELPKNLMIPIEVPCPGKRSD
jgi:hypothetical protein